jgi:hypothetical protein
MQQDRLSAKLAMYTIDESTADDHLSNLVDEKTFRQLVLLEELIASKFDGITLNIKQNRDTLWKAFLSNEDPYAFMSQQSNFEHFNFSTLNKFQKLILIKLLRPDALVLAINQFIGEILGSKFCNLGVASLGDLYHRSKASTPIIFILSPGMQSIRS